MIDGLLLLGVSIVLAERLGLPNPDPEMMSAERFFIEAAPGLVLDVAVWLVYGMIFIGTWGGTIGKLVLGLRVVRFSDGARVPYGLALGRNLAEFVSLLPVGLGYLWIGLTPSKRGWHDYLCDTRVVHAKAK